MKTGLLGAKQERGENHEKGRQNCTAMCVCVGYFTTAIYQSSTFLSFQVHFYSRATRLGKCRGE